MFINTSQNSKADLGKTFDYVDKHVSCQRHSNVIDIDIDRHVQASLLDVQEEVTHFVQ